MKHSLQTYRGVLFTLTLMALGVGAHGQGSRPVGLAYGIHAGISFQSFRLESDLPGLQGLQIPADGVTGGFEVSIGQISSAVSLTKYVTNPAATERVDKSSFQGTMRYYPGRNRMVRPFVMAGINSSSFYFRSIVSLPAEQVSETHDPCDDMEGDPMGKPGAEVAMPGDSDSSPADNMKVEQHVKLTGLQGVGGAGIELNFASNGQYIKLFSSVSLGIPIHHASSSATLSNTTVNSQLFVSFGVGIGLQR